TKLPRASRSKLPSMEDVRGEGLSTLHWNHRTFPRSMSTLHLDGHHCLSGIPVYKRSSLNIFSNYSACDRKPAPSLIPRLFNREYLGPASLTPDDLTQE
ncbi:hypothetical protein FHG87_017908, partial [Trinorchestia longiramus]